jgi:anti-sigma B factor antagonist
VTDWSPASRAGRVPQVELKVSSRSQGDQTIVAVAGEIDLYTAPRLHSELAAAVTGQAPARVVVDMAAVDFCDSTGMNVLLAALRRARERGGDLVLAGPRPAVRKILQVTGLESVFTVLDDPAALAGQ